MRILGISGSLRQGSFNAALLHAATRHLPEGAVLEVYGFGDLPLYRQELDGATKPAPVQDLLDRVAGADALLIATPEYNYSVPGGLKNAIDWASRPAFRSPLRHKPAGILSASPGPTGGARAQAHLKQILAGTLTPVLPAPDFLVPMAAQKFDAAGRLTDAETAGRLSRYLADLVRWAGGHCALDTL